MAEKIRLVLVAKREKLLAREFQAGSEDERILMNWVKMQNSYNLPIDGIPDEFKIKVAETLAKMYGDPVLNKMYLSDDSLSEEEQYEAILDEILFQNKVRHIATIKDGAQFGEQAILRDSIRTASVRCMEDTHLCYITKADFERMYNNIMKAKQDRRIQFLKAIPLFGNLSKHYLQKMTGMFHRVDYIRNQYVF